VEGWSGGVWQAGRDSGSLSGLSVGSKGSYLSMGSGGVIGPLEGVESTVGSLSEIATSIAVTSFSSSGSLAKSTTGLVGSITL